MNATGGFIWYELMTSDAAAAAKFYIGGVRLGAIMQKSGQNQGGDWIVIAVDPQGALFGLVGPQGASA